MVDKAGHNPLDSGPVEDDKDSRPHDGNYKLKKDIIESIDKYFFGNLLSVLDIKNTIIAVTADHSTVCAVKAHTADPVPLLISGGNVKLDGSLSFSEKSARLGSIGEITGREIMPLLIKTAKE